MVVTLIGWDLFPFSLSVQTVCQDGGGDEVDDEDQQVKCSLTAYESES